LDFPLSRPWSRMASTDISRNVTTGKPAACHIPRYRPDNVGTANCIESETISKCKIVHDRQPGPRFECDHRKRLAFIHRNTFFQSVRQSQNLRVRTEEDRNSGF
jgi:hypothetical protein